MSCVQTGCTMPTSFQGVPFPAKPGKRLLRSVAFVFAWCGFTTKNTKDLSFVNSIAQLEGGTGGQKAGPCSLELRMAWCFAVEYYKATATVQYTQCALVENPSLHEFYTSSECTRVGNFHFFWVGKNSRLNWNSSNDEATFGRKTKSERPGPQGRPEGAKGVVIAELPTAPGRER